MENKQQQQQNMFQAIMPDTTNRADRRTLFAKTCLSETFCCVYFAKAKYTQQNASEFFGEALFGTFCSLWQKVQENPLVMLAAFGSEAARPKEKVVFGNLAIKA